MESAESWKLERVPSVYWLTLVMPRSEVQFRIHVGLGQQMWTRDRQWAQVVQVEMVRSESSLSGIGSWGARIAYGAQAKLKTERVSEIHIHSTFNTFSSRKEGKKIEVLTHQLCFLLPRLLAFFNLLLR